MKRGLITLLLWAAAATAIAQDSGDYPNRPVHVIVATAAGLLLVGRPGLRRRLRRPFGGRTHEMAEA